MRNVLLFGLAVLVLTCTATAYGAFVAYNDASSSAGTPANTTEYRGNGTTSGLLKDFDTGYSLPVTITMSSAVCVYDGNGGPMPSMGTDAYNTFNGKVVFDDVVYYGTANGGFWMDAVFTGLNPSLEYEFATSVNRGGGTGSDYLNRFSKFTISNIDSATQSSTAGVTVNSPTSVTFCTGENTATGYVARWTQIKPGIDGTFKVRVEDGGGVGKGYAMDGIMLKEIGGSPPEPPPPPPPTVTTTFQQGLAGYTGTKDTYVEPLNPDLQHGAAAVTISDTDPMQQGLVRFDEIFGSGADKVPVGATIYSAKLKLYTVNSSATSTNLHRMLGDWADSATWNSLTGGITADGIEAALAADATVTPSAANAWIEIDVKAALQAWANDPSSNHGWAFLPNGTDGWQWDSAETAGYQPTLTVSHVVPEPSTLILLGMGTIGLLAYAWRRRK